MHVISINYFCIYFLNLFQYADQTITPILILAIYQNNLWSVAQSIEGIDAPEDVFRAVVENSFQLSSGESGPDGLVDELCGDEGLVSVCVLGFNIRNYSRPFSCIMVSN